MIKKDTLTAEQTTIISFEPLSLPQLQSVVSEIIAAMYQYRPEFSRLIWLQRRAGTRVTELFQPNRWEIQNNNVVYCTPQKKNALRVLNFIDIGFKDADEFQLVVADMRRLPQRQYERAFAKIVADAGLWRLYNDGYLHPSTHLLRHLRIKELAAEGQPKSFIASWIGEKNEDNLDYYIGSQFYL